MQGVRRLAAESVPSWLLAATLTLAAPGAAAFATSTALSPAQQGSRVVVLDHVRVHLSSATTQVVTVRPRHAWHATITYWRRGEDGWHRVRRALDARIGYGGPARPQTRVQGSGTTPTGTYRLISLFGTHASVSPGGLPYRQIQPGDFWVQDNKSAFYNSYRNQAQGGFRWRLPTSHPDASERLTDYPTEYEWSIVTSFNRRQVRHRGSGIFLHVNGAAATAGCVSAPREFIRRLVADLDPQQKPVVAIGVA